MLQEAIKTINDIHSLMQLSKKKPKPQALANYYKKQALVFSKANNRWQLEAKFLDNRQLNWSHLLESARHDDYLLYLII